MDNFNFYYMPDPDLVDSRWPETDVPTVDCTLNIW